MFKQEQQNHCIPVFMVIVAKRFTVIHIIEPIYYICILYIFLRDYITLSNGSRGEEYVMTLVVLSLVVFPLQMGAAKI